VSKQHINTGISMCEYVNTTHIVIWMYF